MFFVSEPISTPPSNFNSELHKRVYSTLKELHIPFERVDTDPAITMADCELIDEKLQMKTVKTLFLCNRQQTAFYLFITTADKPFVTKDFSSALGISRVSFASETLLWERLRVKIGAATIFGLLMDPDHEIQLVIDKDILLDPWYGCSDGTTTGYMKLGTEDVMKKFLEYVGHEARIVGV